MSEIKGQLEISNPAEALAGWERVGTNPNELAQWMTKVFSVKFNSPDSALPIVISQAQPENSEGIWIKTDIPVGIGVPISGGYKMIYEYPPYVPFIYARAESTKPSYLRKMSPTELTALGLTNPEESEYYYVIFEP